MARPTAYTPAPAGPPQSGYVQAVVFTLAALWVTCKLSMWKMRRARAQAGEWQVVQNEFAPAQAPPLERRRSRSAATRQVHIQAANPIPRGNELYAAGIAKAWRIGFKQGWRLAHLEQRVCYITACA